MPAIKIIITFLIGYFLGSIPFGYIFSKSKKNDIRQFGSGNIGATNVFRKFGLSSGFLVGLLDFLKSYLFVFVVFNLSDFSLPIKLIITLSPIIGHIFPIWLKFKGGKGVGTTFGLLAAIFGWKFFIIWFIIWLFLLLNIHLMSLINLLMSLLFPFIFWFYFKSTFPVILGLIVTVILWWTHRQNIKKLINKTESKIYLFKKPKI